MAIRHEHSSLTTLVEDRFEELIGTGQQIQDAMEADRVQWRARHIETWPNAVFIDMHALCDDRVGRPLIGVTQ